MKRIKFKAVGDLPAPDGHPAPQIFLCDYHPIYEITRMGLPFKNEEDPSKDTRYTFTPMKPQYWSEWKAFAYEDIEFGEGTISACTPEGERFTWTVLFSHDGDRRTEFWGAKFDPPTR